MDQKTECLALSVSGIVSVWLCQCLALSVSGFVSVWLCQCLALSVSGFVSVWHCQCLALSVSGFVSVWLCQCLALSVSGIVMIYLIDSVLPESYFANNLRALSVDMAVFRDLLRLTYPKLSKHLDQLQTQAQDIRTGACYEPPLTNVFTMQWFLTLFATCLPVAIVLRVWDAILLEGSEILLRTALTIWGKLDKRIMGVSSADEFYCLMGELSSGMMQGYIFDGDTMIKSIYSLGDFPFPHLNELREKYTYNIRPLSQASAGNKKNETRSVIKSLINSDEDDLEDDDITAMACMPGGVHSPADISVLGPGVYGPSCDDGIPKGNLQMERMTTDIQSLKLQYEKLKQRQKQAHIIIAVSCIPSSSSSDVTISCIPSTSSCDVIISCIPSTSSCDVIISCIPSTSSSDVIISSASAKKAKPASAYRIGMSNCVLMPSIESPTAMNHLFVGKNLSTSSRNRLVTDAPRIAPPKVMRKNSGVLAKQVQAVASAKAVSKSQRMRTGVSAKSGSVIPVTAATPAPSVIPVTAATPVPSVIPVTAATPVPSVIPVTAATPVPSVTPVTAATPVPSVIPVTAATPVPSSSLPTAAEFQSKNSLVEQSGHQLPLSGSSLIPVDKSILEHSPEVNCPTSASETFVEGNSGVMKSLQTTAELNELDRPDLPWVSETASTDGIECRLLPLREDGLSGVTPDQHEALGKCVHSNTQCHGDVFVANKELSETSCRASEEVTLVPSGDDLSAEEKEQFGVPKTFNIQVGVVDRLDSVVEIIESGEQEKITHIILDANDNESMKEFQGDSNQQLDQGRETLGTSLTEPFDESENIDTDGDDGEDVLATSPVIETILIPKLVALTSNHEPGEITHYHHCKKINSSNIERSRPAQYAQIIPPSNIALPKNHSRARRYSSPARSITAVTSGQLSPGFSTGMRKNSLPFNPFPVKQLNANRVKTGLKLGLYKPSTLEQFGVRKSSTTS
ncbi:hypothetical protein Btru_052811 [Bulinus truncatus]|nr:hypothetical protein Btru_052811 [Bulinus truncatus]